MKLSRQPCAKCNADTLHFVSKCTVCGTVRMCPYEQREHARKRLYARRGMKHVRGGVFITDSRQEFDQLIEARNAEEAKRRDSNAQVRSRVEAINHRTRSVFGTGRERTVLK